MDICISHDSAIGLLREARSTTGATLVPTQLTTLPHRARGIHVRLDRVETLGMSSIKARADAGRLDIISPSASRRICSTGIQSHSYKGPIPSGEVLCVSRFGESLYVVGPALCFVHAAQVLSDAIAEGELAEWQAVARLVAFGAEMCGTYARDAISPKTGPCTFRLLPLIAADELRRRLQELHGLRGVSLARKAAALVFDGSASPMETLHRMMLSLPSEYGSLGLLEPSMNRQVDIDPRLAHLLSSPKIRADLSWERLRVAVEHLGEEWHDLSGRTPLDARRIQDYQTLGWVVHPTTFEDVRTPGAYNAFALRLCRSLEDRGLGGTVSAAKLLLEDGEFLARQAMLLAMLLPPVTHYDNLV